MVWMALKQEWIWFAAGFPTLGLAWIVGVLSTQKPSTRVIVLAVGAILLVGFLASRPALVIGVDGRPLQNSVDRLLAETERCRQANGRWICFRYDSLLSGDRGYLIEVDRGGCWTGTPMRNGPGDDVSGIDSPIEGCITLKDYI